MRRAIVIVVMAATACSGGDDKPAPKPEKRAVDSPPKQVPEVLPEKPTSFTHRLLLEREIPIPELRGRVEKAAGLAKLSYTKGGPKSKCRRVQYLDAGGALRAEGLSLRVRRKLDRRCLIESNRLAMSFNLRTGDLSRAHYARTELTPNDELASDRTRLRYRLDTSIGPKVYTPRYIAGGTVRGLNEQPASLDALRAIYPELPVEGSGELVPVITVDERNYDFGSVSSGSVTMPIEVAVWSRDKKHVVTELSYEYDSAEGAGAMATTFARALKTELDGAIHSAEWREDVAYAAGPAPSPESRP